MPVKRIEQGLGRAHLRFAQRTISGRLFFYVFGAITIPRQSEFDSERGNTYNRVKCPTVVKPIGLYFVYRHVECLPFFIYCFRLTPVCHTSERASSCIQAECNASASYIRCWAKTVIQGTLESMQCVSLPAPTYSVMTPRNIISNIKTSANAAYPHRHRAIFEFNTTDSKLTRHMGVVVT